MSDLRPLPYYKWYWLDWRGNRTVQRMSYIERGLYRELLDECWSEGGIPNDIEMLADICGCPVEVMADAWQVLSKCFIDSGNCLANGKQLLANERLENERTAKDKERINKANNGRLGGTAKALKNNDVVASAKQVLASPSKCHIEEKRREENKPPSKMATLDYPDGLNHEAWGKWVEYRKQIKKPLRQASMQSAMKALVKYGSTQLEVVEQSIANGWQGLFELKHKQQPVTDYDSINGWENWT